MTTDKAPIEVVGAVIANQAGEVLCALRSASMSMPGYWEFPGGKIDPAEAPEAALVREIEEELGCTIAVAELVADCTHPYPGVTVRLRTYRATVTAGAPAPAEHAEIRWMPVGRLAELEWAPADLPSVEALMAAYR